MSLILTSVGWIAGIGVVCGAALALAAKYLGVHEDPRVEKLTELLPGINCGGCGFAGCSAYAQALLGGGVATNLCAPGGRDVAENVAGFLGVAAAAAEPRFALVLCCGDNDQASKRFAYDGITSCGAAQAVAGGDKGCTYGCLGYADCARVCPVDAISVENGLARVHREICISCGKCVAACPRSIIRMVPADHSIHVLCCNQDKGGVVRSLCATGCIACRMCTKIAEGAINMDRNLAVVDYTKPLTNEDVIAKCPVHCIRKA